MKSESQRSVWKSTPNIVALIAVFIGAVDMTVVATILPSMISDLGINTADIDRYIWVVNSYLIAYVVSIPIVGRVTDLIGVRTVFIVACLVFAIGSILCARADSLQDLVIARSIQGFGGGALLPIALSVAAQSFTGAHRAQAIGAVGAVDTLGWVSGPAWGALVTHQLTFIEEPWRLVFWINVPVAALLIGISRMLPAAPASNRDAPSVSVAGITSIARQLDLPGFVFLTAFLVSINLALASGGEIGATAGRGLRAFGGTSNPLADLIPWLLAASAISLFLLAVHVRSRSNTLLPLRLLNNASYRASLIANALLGTVLMAGLVNVPIVVALAETSTDTGVRSAILLAPFTLAIAASSIVSAWLLRQHSPRRVTMIGLAVATVGNLMIYPLLESVHYQWMAVGLGIAGIGIGLALTPLSTTALDSSSSSSYGVAASTLLVSRLLGMTVGISLLTSIGVRRLQVLTGDLESIVRDPTESTAEFLLRQQEFIIDHAVPLGVQVVQETFIVAAILTACAFIPARALHGHSTPLPPED